MTRVYRTLCLLIPFAIGAGCSFSPSSPAVEGLEHASSCGNGIVDPDEACEDGNDVLEDGCEPDCSITDGWTCNNVEGLSLCAPNCPAGWTVGADAQTCVDVDECAAVSACGVGGHCTNTDGSYFCACDPGYVMSGARCENVDECETGAAACDGNAACVDTEGGYTCTCNAGFSGDGQRCENVDECTALPTPCPEAASCLDTVGGFECHCASGYRISGDRCVNVDECEEGLDACHSDAACTDTEGAYACTCDPGYEGDGDTCVNIDECATGAASCGPGSTCFDTEGGYDCQCASGYVAVSGGCSDVDECAGDQDLCHRNATCRNLEGAYACGCDPGFSGDGEFCTNIDECADGIDSCDPNAACSDTVGGYECTCDSGYEGDGFGCADIDDCAADPCEGDLVCIDETGDRRCECPSGFTLSGNICEDIDECLAEEILNTDRYFSLAASRVQKAVEIRCRFTPRATGSVELLQFAGLQHRRQGNSNDLPGSVEVTIPRPSGTLNFRKPQMQSHIWRFVPKRDFGEALFVTEGVPIDVIINTDSTHVNTQLVIFHSAAVDSQDFVCTFPDNRPDASLKVRVRIAANDCEGTCSNTAGGYSCESED